ncbi:MAG: hypothetical protein mread185_000522 [Mycoplasmataceae bacterium]|nr:MAG: hypothetical protein mread185_000522 [Mycoplasmataceae bacterium]
MAKIKLKTGDQVKVITGQYFGVIDYISRLDLKKEKIYLKKVNRKKYDKSTPESKQKSEMKEIMIPIHLSNVAYWSEDKKGITKVGLQIIEQEKEGKSEKTKVRVSRKFKDKRGNNLSID